MFSRTPAWLPVQGTSPFPLIDFASRAISNGSSDDSLAKILADTAGGDDKIICQKLSKTVVHLGDIKGGTMERELSPLLGQEVRAREAIVQKIGFSITNHPLLLKTKQIHE